MFVFLCHRPGHRTASTGCFWSRSVLLKLQNYKRPKFGRLWGLFLRKKAGLPRQQFLCWQTSLQCIVGELVGVGLWLWLLALMIGDMWHVTENIFFSSLIYLFNIVGVNANIRTHGQIWHLPYAEFLKWASGIWWLKIMHWKSLLYNQIKNKPGFLKINLHFTRLK